ncbi:hypothetical protein GCM10020256_03810 [Streptomyces thermocoprophilus]
MSATASADFDTETLRRGVEGETPDTLVSLYTDDATLRIVNRNSQPSHPQELRGRSEIAAMIQDVYSREMTHHLEGCVVQGDHAAFCESCEYPDGTRGPVRIHGHAEGRQDFRADHDRGLGRVNRAVHAPRAAPARGHPVVRGAASRGPASSGCARARPGGVAALRAPPIPTTVTPRPGWADGGWSQGWRS